MTTPSPFPSSKNMRSLQGLTARLTDGTRTVYLVYVKVPPNYADAKGKSERSEKAELADSRQFITAITKCHKPEQISTTDQLSSINAVLL